jgi:hypothetical protein
MKKLALNSSNSLPNIPGVKKRDKKDDTAVSLMMDSESVWGIIKSGPATLR